MSSAQPAANANRLDAYRSCCKRGCTNQQAAHLLHTCLHPPVPLPTEWICPKPDCGLVSRRLLDNPAVMLTPLPADSLCSCKSCHRVHQPNDQRFPVVAYCDKCNLRMCRNRLAAHVYDNCNGQVQHLPDPRPPAAGLQPAPELVSYPAVRQLQQAALQPGVLPLGFLSALSTKESRKTGRDTVQLPDE
uniref:TAZ-type domain-containing protein n=1 Tax=Macrostomum lignano TaxID=282301 RepID=A0A1I8H8D4_9PLAT